MAVLASALRGRTVLDVVQFFLSGGGVKGLDFIAILLRDRTDADMFSGHEGFFVGHRGNDGGCLIARRGGSGYIAGARARMDLFNTGAKGGVIIGCIADGLVDRQVLPTGKRVPDGIVDRFIWIDCCRLIVRLDPMTYSMTHVELFDSDEGLVIIVDICATNPGVIGTCLICQSFSPGICSLFERISRRDAGVSTELAIMALGLRLFSCDAGGILQLHCIVANSHTNGLVVDIVGHGLFVRNSEGVLVVQGRLFHRGKISMVVLWQGLSMGCVHIVLVMQGGLGDKSKVGIAGGVVA